MPDSREVWTKQTSDVESWTVLVPKTEGVGLAEGIATVSGVGEGVGLGAGIGLAAGAATVAGVATATASTVGQAAGSATVSGAGDSVGILSGAGLAEGIATVSGVGNISGEAAGLAEGAATVSGVGAATARTTGLAAGLATPLGAGAWTFPAAGAAAGVATAVAASEVVGDAIPAVIYNGVSNFGEWTGGTDNAADGQQMAGAVAFTRNSDGSRQTLYKGNGTTPWELYIDSSDILHLDVGTSGAIAANELGTVIDTGDGVLTSLFGLNGNATTLSTTRENTTPGTPLTGTNTPGTAANVDFTADMFIGQNGSDGDFLDANVHAFAFGYFNMDATDSDIIEQFVDLATGLPRNPANAANWLNDSVTWEILEYNTAASHGDNPGGAGGAMDVRSNSGDGTSPGTWAEDFVATPAAVTFTDSAADGSNSSTYTFSARSLGAEAADRHIIVCVGTEASSDLQPSSVTVAGSGTTEVVWHKSAGGNGQCGIFIVALPAGTTGDVVVTLGALAARCLISIFRATGLGAATASDSDFTDGTSLGATLTIPNDGIAVACSLGSVSSDTCAWTNITERAEDSADVGATTMSSASDDFATGGNITLTPAWATGAVDDAATFAAWAP